MLEPQKNPCIFNTGEHLRHSIGNKKNFDASDLFCADENLISKFDFIAFEIWFHWIWFCIEISYRDMKAMLK